MTRILRSSITFFEVYLKVSKVKFYLKLIGPQPQYYERSGLQSCSSNFTNTTSELHLICWVNGESCEKKCWAWFFVTSGLGSKESVNFKKNQT